MINLGAGFDSTYFRLKNQLDDNTLFIDIDFPDVINRKLSLIKSNEILLKFCPDMSLLNITNGSFIYKSFIGRYVLIGIDLRDTQLLEAMLKFIEEFDDSAPTLLLSEVVMTYMAVNSCNHILKWIPETFSNSMIAVYEQVLPHDAFGQVMCAHFKKLGSPLKCIYRYPNIENQIKRYKDFGFNDCQAMRVIDFFKKEINNEERSRVDLIEIFDEYEQWHLKCTHYSLVLAANGILLNLMNSLIDESFDYDFKYEPISSENLITISEFPLKFGVRFGHSMCYSETLNTLYVIGGFGESINEVGRHKRLNSIEIIDLNKLSFEISKTPYADRLFGTACVSNGDNNIFLIFGRSSPNKVYEMVSLTGPEEKKDQDISSLEFSATLFEKTNETPLSRWRHASCKLKDERIVIFGGKSFNIELNKIETLDDLHIFSKSENKWTKIKINENLIKSIHSHSMCTWGDYVIISGGLDENEDINDKILLLNTNNNEINHLTINNGFVLPRYSHTSHIINNHLFLVGGVNFHSKKPGLCIIDLKNLKAIEIDLPVQISDGTPLMIHNHQGHVLDENNILIVGGGGNCFSFGTHINKKPIIINIKNCWKLFQTNN